MLQPIFLEIDPAAFFYASVTFGGLLAGFIAGWLKLNRAEVKVAEIHKLTNSSMSKMFVAVGVQSAVIAILVIYSISQGRKVK